jgi:hypothetical protein
MSSRAKTCARWFPVKRVCAKNEKIESTVRYLGVEVDEALLIAEQVDV